MSNKQFITDNDLMKNQYNLDILENNIKHLNTKILICTQILNADFCIKYIFDPDIESGSEDSYIFDKYYIMEKQKHITDEEFDKSYNKLFNKE